MQRLEVSGAVRPIYGSLGVKRLSNARVDNVWSWLSQTFKCTEAVAKGWTSIKNVFLRSLFICKWSRIHWRFVSPRIKCKGFRSTRCWAVTRNLLADIYWHGWFSSLRCEKLTPEVHPSIWDITCITETN